MRTITVINQKGGVGKTTTTVNVGAALARLGKRVLLIDLDPQAHMSLHLGFEPDSDTPGSYELLIQSKPIDEVMQPASDRLDVVASHIDLAAAEIELVSVVGREVILRDAIAAAGDRWDYALIDCPPSLSVLTLNALAAADEVFIPLQPHFLALQGMGKLLETVQLVRQRINPKLCVSGIVMCMFESGTRLSAEVVDDLSNFLAQARHQPVAWQNARIFETRIRRNIKLAECPSHGLAIFDYEPNSNGAADYGALAEEVLAMNGEAAQPEALARQTPSTEAIPAGPKTPVAEPTAATQSVAVDSPVATPIPVSPPDEPTDMPPQPPVQPSESHAVTEPADPNPASPGTPVTESPADTHDPTP